MIRRFEEANSVLSTLEETLGEDSSELTGQISSLLKVTAGQVALFEEDYEVAASELAVIFRSHKHGWITHRGYEAEILGLFGLAQIGSGRIGSGIERLERSMEIFDSLDYRDRYRAIPFLGWARVYRLRGDRRAAEESFLRAIEEMADIPRNFVARWAAADFHDFLLESGRTREAREFAEADQRLLREAPRIELPDFIFEQDFSHG